MRGLIRQAAVVAGAAMVLAGSAAVEASASLTLSWSPTTSPGTYNYGTVNAGQTVSQVFTLTNSGSTATSGLTVTLTSPAKTTTVFRKTLDGCSKTTLAPNASCSITVAYAPTTPGQTSSANLTATSGGVALASLTLTGTCAQPVVLNWSPTTSPGTYDYGAVSVGGKASQVFTLTNSGIRSSGPLTVTLTKSAFVIVNGQDGCTGARLAPDTSCSVTVAFVPGRVGLAYTAKLTTTSGKPALASLTLTGTGAPRVVLSWSPTTSPGAYDYGAVNLGQTVSQAFTLTNSGSTSTSRLDLTLRGSNVFQRLKSSCGILAPDTSCGVTVSFVPAASGQAYSATLTATSSLAATASLTLTGTGGAKASPAVSTSASPGGPAGTTVTDSATLSGGLAPGGSIEFQLYGPSTAADCSGTPVDDETVTVIKGNSNYTTPTGASPTQAGTYWWTASYSGDANNNQAATSCGDEQVVIGKASPVISTSASLGGPPGTMEVDTATLSGGSVPGGSIEFKLYGPSTAADCSGTPVDDETVTVSGNGDYTTHTGAKPSQAGTYWWTAAYSGDANNNSAATNCGDEQVVIGKASPAISTSASPGGPSGTTVTDTANLSGGSAPGGSIEFQLYGPSTAADCSGTPVDDESVTVSGNGDYTTPTGAAPIQAGTYWWTAAYSGDANNNSAATNCGDEQVVIGKASPAISTSASAGGPPGTTVTDSASLSGGSAPGGSIEFQLYGPSTAADCSSTPVDDESVTVSRNGNYTTPTGATLTQAGTYWWTASYSGDANNNSAATSCGDEQVTITSSAPFGYLSQFGSFGTGNGQFNAPFGVAVDPATGDVYVTDHGNNRVEKFDSSGTYLSQFGSFGDATDPGGAPGQFSEPQGEAVDPATSDLYVADTGNNRVEKFDSSGTYLSQFGSFGTGNGQFDSSFGVAVDPATGDVYVTDYGNNRVEKFDSGGTYLAQFGSSGTGNGQFRNPVGVAVDPATGDVYVADSGNGRVEKFDSSGTYLSQFGSFGSGNGQFESVQYVAVDPATGDVYVTDGSNRVQEFDSSGTYLSQFGSSGTGNGQFNMPECVAVDPATSDVYVVDSGHNRVEKFGQ